MDYYLNVPYTNTMATDTINSANLTPQATLQVPTYQPTPVDPNIAQGALASVAGQASAFTEQQRQKEAELQANRDSQNSISAALLGKTADTQAFQDQAGVNTAKASQDQYTQQIYDLNAQASSLQKEAEVAKQNAIKEGRQFGAVSSFVTSQQNEIERNRAIKALEISANADIAQASLLGSQLKLQSAKDKAQQMVDLKYKPLEDMLAMKKNQYELNKDVLASIDKKRTEALNAAIKKEEAQIAEQKAMEKDIQSIALTLRKNGVNDSIIKDVLSSKSIKDALIKAGNNLQDPKTILEMENIKAEINLRNAQARKADREAKLTEEPTVEEKKALALAVTQAKASRQAAQDKIEAVDSILSLDTGISSRVGPSVLSRGIIGPTLTGATTGAVASSVVPGVGTVIGGTVGGILGASKGIASTFSGQGQQVSGAVHQLTQGLTLAELQKAKANGATFGALTGPELSLLAQSATKLNDWEVKDDKGNPTGYWNIDEDSFKKELKTIQDLNKKALLKSQGTLITPDESSDLDTMFPEQQPTANQYYQ